MSEQTVEVAVICIAESEKAILADTGEGQVWVPKSVISEDSEVQGEGDQGTLEVAQWFGRKQGWG